MAYNNRNTISIFKRQSVAEANSGTCMLSDTIFSIIAKQSMVYVSVIA